MSSISQTARRSAFHNVIMHALVDGYGYSLQDRRVLGPDELRAESLEQRIAYT